MTFDQLSSVKDDSQLSLTGPVAIEAEGIPRQLGTSWNEGFPTLSSAPRRVSEQWDL